MDIRRGSLSYILLTILEKTIDGYVRFDDFINNPKLYAFGTERSLRKSALSKAISRLKEKGFVEKEVNIDEITIKLTDTGRTALLLTDDTVENWDGKWRIVVFDIPEQKRIIRNLFRRNLKKWGFKGLQKSVWISKKNVTEKLFQYIKDVGVERWVWVFESEKYGPLDIT